ncbi:MAG: hypothetical protein ACE5H9_17135 [Anaerolineae bacterium]
MTCFLKFGTHPEKRTILAIASNLGGSNSSSRVIAVSEQTTPSLDEDLEALDI